MKFERGFKSYCERLVQDVRKELGLEPDEPLDMEGLAESLEIKVFALGDFVRASGTSETGELAEIYSKVSAFTFFDGTVRIVVYNERHASARHRSNLAHELAHALLLHPPRGRGIPASQEELHESQAAWLSGVLMLTAEQARRIAATRLNHAHAQERYRVSPEMLRYRLNVTGAARMARQ